VKFLSTIFLFSIVFLIPELAFASTGGTRLDLTNHTVGYAALAIFVNPNPSFLRQALSGR
jgi:hypothetical protein